MDFRNWKNIIIRYLRQLIAIDDRSKWRKGSWEASSDNGISIYITNRNQ